MLLSVSYRQASTHQRSRVFGGARADGFIESLAAAGFVQTTAQEIEYKGILNAETRRALRNFRGDEFSKEKS